MFSYAQGGDRGVKLSVAYAKDISGIIIFVVAILSLHTALVDLAKPDPSRYDSQTCPCTRAATARTRAALLHKKRRGIYNLRRATLATPHTNLRFFVHFRPRRERYRKQKKSLHGCGRVAHVPAQMRRACECGFEHMAMLQR